MMPSSTPVTVTFCGVSQFAVVNWIKLSTVASPVSDDVMERTTSELGCVFNKIKGDLARLIAAGIKNSLAKKQNRTPQNANQTRPQGNNSGLIPPIPPEGFYTPSNPCETEDIIADVFSNVMGDITQAVSYTHLRAPTRLLSICVGVVVV